MLRCPLLASNTPLKRCICTRNLELPGSGTRVFSKTYVDFYSNFAEVPVPPPDLCGGQEVGYRLTRSPSGGLAFPPTPRSEPHDSPRVDRRASPPIKLSSFNAQRSSSHSNDSHVVFSSPRNHRRTTTPKQFKLRKTVYHGPVSVVCSSSNLQSRR
jgi:hypothetical protein